MTRSSFLAALARRPCAWFLATLVCASACSKTLPVVDAETDANTASGSVATPDASAKGGCRAANDADVVFSSKSSPLSGFRIFENNIYVVQRQYDEFHFTTGVAIRRLGVDGSNVTLLYQVPEPENYHIGDLLPSAGGIYFTMSDNTIDSMTHLYKLPLAGGEPSMVTGAEKFDFNLADFEFEDAENIYVSKAAGLVRIAKATGEWTIVFELKDGVGQLQVYQNDVWFTMAVLGAGGVGHVPLNSVEASITQYSTRPCGGGSLFVGSSGVFCGEDRFEPDGTVTAITKLFQFYAYEDRNHIYNTGFVPTHEGGSSAIMRTRIQTTDYLMQVDTSTFSYKTFACNPGLAQDLQVTPTHIYWQTSENNENGDGLGTIYRTAR